LEYEQYIVLYIAAKNIDTLLTIVERSSAIIANRNAILSKSALLVLKTIE
jgi:hypothetical protein